MDVGFATAAYAARCTDVPQLSAYCDRSGMLYGIALSNSTSMFELPLQGELVIYVSGERHTRIGHDSSAL